MNDAVILFYERYSPMISDVIEGLPVRQIEALGKFVYQCDNIFNYVPQVVSHNVIIS